MSRGNGRGDGSRMLATRVKTARRRSSASSRWLQRQLNDPYVKKAQVEGYRSRAAFKLLELDDRFGILPHKRAFCRPWMRTGRMDQVLASKVQGGSIVGVDIQKSIQFREQRFLNSIFFLKKQFQRLPRRLAGRQTLFYPIWRHQLQDINEQTNFALEPWPRQHMT